MVLTVTYSNFASVIDWYIDNSINTYEVAKDESLIYAARYIYNMCMYICMHMYTHVCSYVCVPIYVCANVCTYVCVGLYAMDGTKEECVQ